jgi:multisubunit Na+/H+ antiporter MnhB subunit
VHWIALVLALVAVGGLGAAILDLSGNAPGLAPRVESQMPGAVMANPVTLVLLDFRGYDTLLELGVLLLAVVAVWSLGEAPHRPGREAGELLAGFVRLIAPVMILVAGYLLWAGADAPGGAFQAGSVLGALGVILVLAGREPLGRAAGWPLRLALAAGLVVFLSVALGVMMPGGQLLQYPPAHAKLLILLIETAATLSIGVVLAALYRGGRLRPASKGSKGGTS